MQLKRLCRRAALGVSLLVTALFGSPRSASAQTWIGTAEFKSYDIVVQGAVVGKMVAVSCHRRGGVAGFAPGQEHWTWDPGHGWDASFKLVPARTLPTYHGRTWQTFPHDHFDLSTTVPMPAVRLGSRDGFYRVSVKSGGAWKARGYMWLARGAEDRQILYGQGLTADLVGNGQAIRFEATNPPTPGSAQVYLLH